MAHFIYFYAECHYTECRKAEICAAICLTLSFGKLTFGQRYSSPTAIILVEKGALILGLTSFRTMTLSTKGLFGILSIKTLSINDTAASAIMLSTTFIYFYAECL